MEAETQMNGTYKILLVLVALAMLFSGAVAMDTRVDAKLDRYLKPQLEDIKEHLREIKTDIRRYHR